MSKAYGLGWPTGLDISETFRSVAAWVNKLNGMQKPIHAFDKASGALLGPLTKPPTSKEVFYTSGSGLHELAAARTSVLLFLEDSLGYRAAVDPESFVSLFKNDPESFFLSHLRTRTINGSLSAINKDTLVLEVLAIARGRIDKEELTRAAMKVLTRWQKNKTPNVTVRKVGRHLTYSSPWVLQPEYLSLSPKDESAWVGPEWLPNENSLESSLKAAERAYLAQPAEVLKVWVDFVNDHAINSQEQTTRAFLEFVVLASEKSTQIASINDLKKTAKYFSALCAIGDTDLPNEYGVYARRIASRVYALSGFQIKLAQLERLIFLDLLNIPEAEIEVELSRVLLAKGSKLGEAESSIVARLIPRLRWDSGSRQRMLIQASAAGIDISTAACWSGSTMGALLADAVPGFTALLVNEHEVKLLDLLEKTLNSKFDSKAASWILFSPSWFRRIVSKHQLNARVNRWLKSSNDPWLGEMFEDQHKSRELANLQETNHQLTSELAKREDSLKLTLASLDEQLRRNQILEDRLAYFEANLENSVNSRLSELAFDLVRGFCSAWDDVANQIGKIPLEQLAARIDTTARGIGISHILEVGSRTRYDKSTHQQIGPLLAQGDLATVIRPGYQWLYQGQLHIIERPVLQKLED